MAKTLYIIAGCNGAGKTTASFAILPTILKCKEFINADEIARGLSPFNPEGMAIQAGKIMLVRIVDCLNKGIDFAIETTLSGKGYLNLIAKAKAKGYKIALIFYWLENVDLAIQRVAKRVLEGGHDIPVDVIKRRYTLGLKNFFNLYSKIVNKFLFFNSTNELLLLAEGNNNRIKIFEKNKWENLKNKYNESSI
jgi:predicted ABC-type ATPase